MRVTERRKNTRFTETISTCMVRVAAAGAFIVLLDVRFTLNIWGHVMTIGSHEGFSADLKGAVITAILVSGFTAVKEYWLGGSAQNPPPEESPRRVEEVVTTTTKSVAGEPKQQGDT